MPSPSPVVTPCITMGPPPDFTAVLTTTPAHPKVGDRVTLSFAVQGGGGIPQFTLKGTAPIFAGEAKPLYAVTNGRVEWTLAAAQAGRATVTLGVIYEAPTGCSDAIAYAFLGDEAGPFTVEVTS